MRYVAIDIETTGLDPKTCQVLQVAMVLEDTEKSDLPVEHLPHFECLVSHALYQGQPYALYLNHDILHRLAKTSPSDQIFSAELWHLEASTWLSRATGSTKTVAAGKNVAGFDLQFFPNHLRKRFHHRVIDPGSVFIDWSKDVPPALGDLTGKTVMHTALEDARDVIRVLRKAYT